MDLEISIFIMKVCLGVLLICTGIMTWNFISKIRNGEYSITESNTVETREVKKN